MIEEIGAMLQSMEDNQQALLEANEAIVDALESASGEDVNAPEVEEDFGLLFYPPGAQPVSDPNTLTSDDYTKTVGEGQVSIDFMSGEVTLPNGTKEETSQSIGDIEGARSVESLAAKANERVIWYIPDQESGTYSKSFELEGADLGKINIQTFQATEIAVLASTSEEIKASDLFPDPSFTFGAPDHPNRQVVGHDLVADGDLTIGDVGVARSEAAVVAANSTDGNTWSASVDWQNDAGDVFQSESAADINLSSVAEDWARLVRKGPRVQVTFTDESGAGSNEINAHVDTER